MRNFILGVLVATLYYRSKIRQITQYGSVEAYEKAMADSAEKVKLQVRKTLEEREKKAKVNSEFLDIIKDQMPESKS